MPDRKKLPVAAKLGIAAAALAGMALFNRKKARDAEAGTPPIGKFVEVDGVRLHYVERGDGPPLVMLHGMGALIQDFLGSGLIDRAAERFRVLAFDRPGYGYSDRPRGQMWTPEAQAALVRAALVKLGVERPLVLGHSWGTLPALAFALDNPGETAGLVLLSGPYFPIKRPDPLLLALPSLPLLGTGMANTTSPLMARLTGKALLKQVFAPNPIPPRFETEFPKELAIRPGQIQAVAGDAGLLQMAELRLAKRYTELKLPVGIGAGDGDRLVPPHFAEQLHEVIPHSVLRIVPGVGHMIHWIALDQVVSLIEEIGDSAGSHSSRA
jgi:pimeloyl-ACP methyl ester carboxylesterase